MVKCLDPVGLTRPNPNGASLGFLQPDRIRIYQIKIRTKSGSRLGKRIHLTYATRTITPERFNADRGGFSSKYTNKHVGFGFFNIKLAPRVKSE